MPGMGMGSLQDALNKKIQERNNKSGGGGGGVVSKPTQQPPPPVPQLVQSNSSQSKLKFFITLTFVLE